MWKTVRSRERVGEARAPGRGALLVIAVLVAGGCGGGDDCAGFISVNASPAECQALAERFGCSSFDVDGPSCGLVACARCGDLDEDVAAGQ